MLLGVGELLWDVYPGDHKVAGGSPFNFAYHCHALGHPAHVVSAVGDDALGRELRARVRGLGMSDEFVQTVDAPTGTVRVTLGGAGVPSYEVAEGVAWDRIAWTPELAALRPVAVQFGTLAQRGPSAGVIRRVAAGGAVRVFDVNLRQPGVDVAMLRASLAAATVVKLTDEELPRVLEMLGLRAGSPRALFEAGPGAFGQVWLTRGERGAEVWSHDGDTVVRPASPANVVDTVGAGDAFTAAMLVKLLAGEPPAEALRFACEYAAKVCEYAGAIPPGA